MATLGVSLLLSSLVCNLFAAPIYFSFLSRFIDCLKNHHAQAWGKLGSPTLILNNGIQNSSNLLVYIIKRSYLEIEDVNLSRLGNKTRTFLLLSLGFMAVTFIGLFLMMLSSQGTNGVH